MAGVCVFGVVVFGGWLAAGGGWGVLLGSGLTVGVFLGVSGRVGVRFWSGWFRGGVVWLWGWRSGELG